MKNILSEFYAKFTSTTPSKPAINSALGGRMYLEQAPDNATFPYAVYSVIANSHDANFTHSIDELTLEVTIVSRDSSGAKEILGLSSKLKTLYDDLSIRSTAAGMKGLTVVRQNEYLNKYPDLKAGYLIWQYNCEFMVRSHI